MENIQMGLSGSLPLQALGKPLSPPPGEAAVQSTGAVLNAFGDALKTQLDNISRLQAESDEAVKTYATGGPIELHNVLMATEKAGLSMQLAVQVRNKLIAAYQELSRMQV